MRDLNSPGLTSTVSGVLTDQDPVATTAAMHDQESPDSIDTVKGVSPEQECYQSSSECTTVTSSYNTTASSVATPYDVPTLAPIPQQSAPTQRPIPSRILPTVGAPPQLSAGQMQE